MAHPLAQAVAKAICLLQYVKKRPPHAENIAATLQACRRLAIRASRKCKAALDELVHQAPAAKATTAIGIPSPAEDDWERRRGIARLARVPPTKQAPRRGGHQLLAADADLSLVDAKPFKAGLYFNGNEVVAGHLPST